MQKAFLLIATAVAILASCDMLDPPKPAAIEIAASADTVRRGNVVGFAGLSPSLDSVTLTATVRDEDGRVFDDDVVEWTSNLEAVDVIATGPRTAKVFWSDMGSTRPLVIEARLRGATAQRALVACGIIQVVAKNSGTLLVGRTVPLAGAGLSYGMSFASPIPDPVAVHWQSSDTSIIDLRGANATAVGVGAATIIASACGLSDTVSVNVVSNGYTVTAIDIAGASMRAMNDDGVVVGEIPGSSPTYVMWDAGTVTDLGSCRPVDINAARQVLCAGAGPMIWENGTMTVRDTLPAGKAINDFGHVSGHAWLWRSPGNHQRQSFFYNAGSGVLNNADEVILGTGGGYEQPVIWTESGIVGLSHRGRYASARGVNDGGDVVGHWEHNGGHNDRAAVMWRRANNWSAVLLRPVRGPIRNDVATDAIDINNAGVVVGTGTHGPFVYSNGRLSLLNHALADDSWTILTAIRINNRGQILATARTSSGVTRAVVLDPP